MMLDDDGSIVYINSRKYVSSFTSYYYLKMSLMERASHVFYSNWLGSVVARLRYFFRWLADVVVVVCRLFLLLTLIDVTDTFTAWSSLYETHTHTHQ